jgi:DNA-binding IclR family transcriptional regulator
MLMSERPRHEHGAGAGRGLSTARSVLKVLTLLAEHPDGVSAADVAARVGKSTSTAYYLLASLCEEGFATRKGRRYQLRSAAASGTPEQQPRDGADAGLEGALDDLFVRTRKRCYLGRLSDGAVEIVGVRGRQGLACMPGLGARIERETMHALAMGKVVLSLLAPEARERFVARGLRRFTPATVTSPAPLLAELEDVLALGFAVECEEFREDFCCVAAPVLDERGRFVATLGLSVTARSFNAERAELTAAVRDVAAISKQMQKSAEMLPAAAATA